MGGFLQYWDDRQIKPGEDWFPWIKQSNLTQAKTLIEEMGYHRRDKEVKELEGQLNPKNS